MSIYSKISKTFAKENSLDGMRKRLENLYKLASQTPEKMKAIEELRTQYELECTAMDKKHYEEESELMKMYMRKEIEILSKGETLILKP